MLLDSDGLPLEQWRDRMSSAAEEFSLARLAARSNVTASSTQCWLIVRLAKVFAGQYAF
ncbi:hypothetical protein O9993_07960 [Vibrio lentus]|nr:hypothetical protein [Vibrio lentus]